MNSPAVEWSAIHGTTNIARYLGITRAAARRLVQTQTIRTYVVAGRTCASADEITRYIAAQTDIPTWEAEGGALLPGADND